MTEARSRFVIVGIANALLFAANAGAAEISPRYQQAVGRASAFGNLLTMHDAAAARASDELVNRGVYQRDRRIRGWLTDLSADFDAAVVTFVGEENSRFVAIHRVTIAFDGEHAPRYEALNPAVSLSESQLARWRARSAALDDLNSRKDRCSEHYNTIVLPGDQPAGQPIRVYLIASTTASNVMLVGGHFLYEYSVDGKHLESKREFTKTCLDMPLTPPKPDTQVAGVMLTHLLDPTPTEVHVFLSKLMNQTIYLHTEANDLNWKIDGSDISLLPD